MAKGKLPARGPLTTADAAAYLEVSVMRVRQFLTQQRIKAKKHGRDWLIDRQSLQRFKEQRDR